jgi:hypothetical protein
MHKFANKLAVQYCESTIANGTVTRDFLALLFFTDLLYGVWAPDFEAIRIFFSFSFSLSYSNISTNPRSKLLQG